MHDHDSLLAAYRRVRARTVALSAPLSAEDQVVQPSADASPTKWHLAHTTWFFEELVLGELRFDPAFRMLFNSYYEALGQRIDRARRGLVTRPDLARVHAYRSDVDARIERALTTGSLEPPARSRLELGLHHEQQHQELILTDIKQVLGEQPLQPAYRELSVSDTPRATPALAYRTFAGGIVDIGAASQGFAFDNERPRHRSIVEPFALANRPIVNAEVLGFIAEGGYREPRLWLADGWDTVRHDGWRAPMYWRDDGTLYTLGGVRAIDPSEPACHLSYYEADALARWLGGRLPTEVEWEVAVAEQPTNGHFADDDRFHPAPSTLAAGDGRLQVFGDVWEWTASAYAPYPGFRPLPGALGEYNGKFMSGQQVLRGGSCLTPRGHVRASYRNFFPPAARWQMTGARIAKDVA
jgi:ergothioneine biosynthesis protein EgtB